MAKSRTRSRGVVRQIVESGLLDAYRLDAAALAAFTLIGISVHRAAPDWLFAYAGVVILIVVVALGKAAPRPPEKVS